MHFDDVHVVIVLIEGEIFWVPLAISKEKGKLHRQFIFDRRNNRHGTLIWLAFINIKCTNTNENINEKHNKSRTEKIKKCIQCCLFFKRRLQKKIDINSPSIYFLCVTCTFFRHLLQWIVLCRCVCFLLSNIIILKSAATGTRQCMCYIKP